MLYYYNFKKENGSVIYFWLQMFSTDMDDTLYPFSSGLNLACRKNIEGTNMNHEDNRNYNGSTFQIMHERSTLVNQ